MVLGKSGNQDVVKSNRYPLTTVPTGPLIGR